MKKPLFTAEQLQYLKTVESECANCESYLASLAALGVVYDDRTAINLERRAAVDRIREIAAHHESQP